MDEKLYSVNALSLNVRSAPSLKGDILAKVKKGELVLILDDENNLDGWSHILTESNVNGYCMSDYISEEDNQ